MWSLYDYQKYCVDNVAMNLTAGRRRQLVQLPTGAGKTVVFSGMTHRYNSAYPNKNVLILVHREELLKQTRRTLYNGFGIVSSAITADNKRIDFTNNVHVGMVETVFNRLKKNPHYIKNVGMLIIDECHLGSFRKIYSFFEQSLIVGFSATPISSNKKHPLKNDFEIIISSIQIKDLIEKEKLSKNITYAIKGIDQSKFKISRGEFENKSMSKEYSNSRNVQNTLIAYQKKCNGQKTIIFNVDIKHSNLVNQLFVNAGLPSKHLDGKSKDREAILDWFKKTPNAILQNVGVATTGFDEPTIRNVIINRSTMSFSLWLQMTGRGGRVHEGKTHFNIIDMGGNVERHGDWSDDVDWVDIFFADEKKKKKNGASIAPIKFCKKCDALMAAQAIVCPQCGQVHPRQVSYDSLDPEFVEVVNNVNVHKLVNTVKKYNQKEWHAFFMILKQSTKDVKDKFNTLSPTDQKTVYDLFETKVREWFKLRKKRYTKNAKEFVFQQFCKAVNFKKESNNVGRSNIPVQEH